MSLKDSLQIADYLLQKAAENGDDLTPMQLLKLVYLCHGWMLGLYGRQLVKDNIEAWAYGPVIRDLYKKVKDYRDKPISERLGNGEPQFDDQEKQVMDQVYTQFGRMPGAMLSRLTHQQGSPWYATWHLSGQNSIISNDMIEDYFHRLALQSHESA
jgi:uncharacterized phage-associated protein